MTGMVAPMVLDGPINGDWFEGGVCGRGRNSTLRIFGQRYSPVRLMCSQPSGEAWASGFVSASLRVAAFWAWDFAHAHAITYWMTSVSVMALNGERLFRAVTE
jgi:hypothetical protein